MDKDVTIDLRAVSDIDISTGKRTKFGQVQPSLELESKVLEGTLKAYITAAGGNPHSKILKELIDFANSPSRAFNVLGSLKGAPTKPTRDFTISYGPSFAVGAGLMADVSFGLYFWNKPNIGVFGTFSRGYVSNMGASVVGQLTLLFGAAPDVLAGDCILFGIDVGPGTGWVLTGSGYIVLSTKFEFIGISFALGIGCSVLPVDYTLQFASTSIAGVNL